MTHAFDLIFKGCFHLKVWVVGHYCETEIIGIYDSEEKAQAVIDAMGQWEREQYQIDEFTLNETL